MERRSKNPFWPSSWRCSSSSATHGGGIRRFKDLAAFGQRVGLKAEQEFLRSRLPCWRVRSRALLNTAELRHGAGMQR